MIFLLASYCFYRRFPDNYQQPNFYAEDGYIFANNILHKGLLASLFTTFNGYYLWAVYLLAKLGFILNALLGHNEFANLPRYLAIASYLFLGFTTTLPVLLFRNYLKPATLALIVLTTLYVPLIGWDYAVIGTIGNAKFAVIYIAFLLLVYRQLAPEKARTIYLVDAGLVICAFTNVTVYPMLLFALLRYLPLKRGKDYWLRILRTPSFVSLLVSGAALLYQLIIIKRDGIPAISGYLDSAYQWGRTIEIFISRSYLYPVLFPINKRLNDVLVVILFLAIAGSGLYLARNYRRIFLFGLVTIFLGTFLFVFKRTGVSAFYNGYHDSGPDQFFYAQNWVFLFIISIAAGNLLSRMKPFYRLAGYAGVLLLAATVYIPHSGSFGRNNFMEQNVGNIYANAKSACQRAPDNQATVTVVSYPATTVVYAGLPNETICTASVLHYQPAEVSLGLAPYNNNYVTELGVLNKVTQTFVSPRNHLDGLDIYFSTFGATVHSPYNLTLLDAACKKPLQTVGLPVSKLRDNSMQLVKFKPIDNSAHQTYCFRIGSGRPTGLDPLALQLSKPDIYTDGITTRNGKAIPTDIVFALHYKD